jgi:hypothetical protein
MIGSLAVEASDVRIGMVGTSVVGNNTQANINNNVTSESKYFFIPSLPY